MAGALAQHAVQAKADEHGDKGENDDGGQREFRSFEAVNIMRLWNGFKGARLRDLPPLHLISPTARRPATLPGLSRGDNHPILPKGKRAWPTRIRSSPTTNGNDDGSAPQVATIAQYIKDLSVESPSSPQVFQWQAQPPQLDVQFHINVNAAGEDVHEVVAEDRCDGHDPTMAPIS